MRRQLLLAFGLLAATGSGAQSFRFDFTTDRKAPAGFIKIAATDRYTPERGYGYDLRPATATDGTTGSGEPFFFSVEVPDGNYRVTATLGSRRAAGETTLRAESRRLFYDNVPTRKGEFKSCTFVVNKRNTRISESESVRIKPRERHKLNWDDKLTIECNGTAPQLAYLEIERVEDRPTVFLCGNSTVVDQDNEPWASWGQLIPRFFTDSICFANYAESGERTDTFIAAGRLKKLLTQMKAGDWILIEFGHNDQKLKGVGKGAFYSYMSSLKVFIDEAQARGAHPVLVTPTCRRSFDAEGRIVDTHEDYPEAMRFLAARERIPLIDLNEMTRTLYEALGVEGAKRAFVHYPAGTYPGQTAALEDNTHFNPYGACQIAKCVIEGMRQLDLPLVRYLRDDCTAYDPAHPDAPESFRWNDSPFTEIEKPDGN